MRLDKFLSHNGFGTRKEVKSLIKKGLVSVNGEVIKVDKYQLNELEDQVLCDGIKIEYSKYVYYLLNKPENYVSATTDNKYPTVIELIDDYYGNDLFPVGRLDIDTTGLLILTNDGVFAHNLLSPKKHVDKEYIALIDDIVDQDDIDAFKNGIILDDFTTHSSSLKILETYDDTTLVSVTIDEGKYHQVKRMFESRHKHVLKLKRIRMKNLLLDDTLDEGKYRKLTEEEINDLKGI